MDMTIKGRLILRFGLSDSEGVHAGYKWFTTEPVTLTVDMPQQGSNWYRDHPDYFEVVGIEHEVKHD